MENIIISDIAARCLGYRLDEVLSRAAQIDFIVDKLKKNSVSKVQLERELLAAFGYFHTIGVETLMYELIMFGLVKEEVRAEEYIFIDLDLRGCKFVDIEVNTDGSISAAASNGKVYEIYQPRIDLQNRAITGKRRIQVKRKYYTWVG